MADGQEISQVANLVMSIMSRDDTAYSSSNNSTLSAGKYMPERLLDYQIGMNGKKIYLVKWFGYPNSESTWEAENKLSCYYMMQEIEEKKQRWIKSGQHAYFPNFYSRPFEYVTGKLSGFDLGHTPELILGATEKDGQILFLVKWEGVFEADLIPRHIANIRCPQLVINFYEERLRWSSQQDQVEEEEEEINVVDLDEEDVTYEKMANNTEEE